MDVHETDVILLEGRITRFLTKENNNNEATPGDFQKCGNLSCDIQIILLIYTG